MEITYKRQHNDSYMIIEADGQPISYEEKMIEKNDISSLLTISTLQLNGKNQYYYNISKKESMRDFFEGEDVDKALIQKVLLYINMGLEEISKYLINQNHILINPDTVFLEKSVEGFRVFLCYNPACDQSLQSQLREVVEWLLTIKADDVYEIYDLCLKDDYTIMELVEALEETEEHSEEPSCYVENGIKVEKVQLEEGDFLADLYKDDEVKEKKKMFEGLRKLFSKRNKEAKAIERQYEDFIIEPDMEITEPTVLLRPEDIKCTGKLVYDGESFGENYVMTGDVFRIGSAETNNATIKSKAVSRHHAKISKVDDSYFLEDLNSLNGTFLNGKIIEYKNPRKLKPMDQISFADVSYVFM